MTHLENYGVQALSTEELKSTDGGFWQYVVAGALYIMSEWDDISAGFSDGINGNEYDYNPCP